MTVRVNVLAGPITISRTGTEHRLSRRSDRIYTLIGLLAWARGDGMTTAQLSSVLWQRPAEGVLRKTVERARRLLHEPQAILNLRGAYMLNERVVTCDLWELEDEALALLGRDDPGATVRWARRAAAVQPPHGVSDRRLTERAQLLAALRQPGSARQQIPAGVRDR